jgi:hypothetical protein
MVPGIGSHIHCCVSEKAIGIYNLNTPVTKYLTVTCELNINVFKVSYL